MEQLAADYETQGYKFLFVYTREAHPGEHFPHHTSFEQKLEQATELRKRYGLERTILVDDLEGTAHHAYGLLPDMSYLVSMDRGVRGRSGPAATQNMILYKADWTDADTLRMILDYQDRRREMRQANRKVGPNHVEFLGFRARQWHRFQDLLDECGPQALEDWDGAMAYWRENPPSHG